MRVCDSVQGPQRGGSDQVQIRVVGDIRLPGVAVGHDGRRGKPGAPQIPQPPQPQVDRGPLAALWAIALGPDSYGIVLS